MQILLLAALVSVSMSAEDFDFTKITPKQNNSTQTTEEKKVKPTSSMTKLEYSFLMPTQQKFLTFLNESGIDGNMANEIYKDCAASPKNAFICAMAYDQGFGKASDTIETYYRIAADANVEVGGRIAKYEFADYKLRTGFGDGIRDYFSNGECYTRKQTGTCFYILGMADYLTKKECRYLNLAKKQGVKTGLINRLCK